MRHKIRNINTKVAEALSAAMTSMWMFWVCLAFLVVVFLFDPPKTAREWSNFLSSNGYQLLALPVLGISSAIVMGTVLKLLRAEMKLIREELALLRQIVKEPQDGFNGS